MKYIFIIIFGIILAGCNGGNSTTIIVDDKVEEKFEANFTIDASLIEGYQVISWDKIENIDGYRLYIYDDDSGETAIQILDLIDSKLDIRFSDISLYYSISKIVTGEIVSSSNLFEVEASPDVVMSCS